MIPFVRVLPVLLLLSQDPTVTDVDPCAQETANAEVEDAWRRLSTEGPRTVLFVVRASFGDGTPARGYISCDGIWCKHDETEYCESSLPFKTDARGTCVFSPTQAWLTDEDTEEPRSLTCRAFVGIRFGLVTFVPRDGHVYVIAIPGSPP
jgi:hypothetical protein